jgi:hypothetical protein
VCMRPRQNRDAALPRTSCSPQRVTLWSIIRRRWIVLIDGMRDLEALHVMSDGASP